jgi:hypothetical protein
MVLANIPKGPEEGPTEKVGGLGGSLQQGTVCQFAPRKWWHTPIESLMPMAFGLFVMIDTMRALASFPWGDSTVERRLAIVLMVSPFSVLIGWIFILSVMTWTDPHRLRLDGNGGLILQSAVRDRRVVIKDIKTVVLAQQENGENGGDALGIRIKFSGGKLKLYRFAEREELLKALKAANPTILVEAG